ncbi:sulfite exporter TauE/SafE family protein, partial [Arthrobacter sp. VKM Ac-2550]|uniref:sulfite exporter TauE/SafE family protein n=1 Tax=Crystallibacter permensis TaxID=1938888 RepID=UPI0022418134
RSKSATRTRPRRRPSDRPVTWAEYVLIAVAVFAAAGLQSSIGFGMGMLAAPVIALVDPALLPASIIILALLLTTMVTARERAHLDLKGAGWALVGRIPGSLLGAWLVVVLPAEGLAWLVAAAVLTGVALAFFGWAPLPGRANLITAGAASGIMGTSTSIGGAPMALIWQGQQGARLRGTMSAFFMVGSAVSLAALAAAGQVTAEVLVLTAWMVPAALAGYIVSRYTNRFLNRRRLRLIALTASGFGAVLLVGRLLLG